jgi:hypothetical protein
MCGLGVLAFERKDTHGLNFALKILRRFSGSSSNDLTERFNNTKQNAMSVSEYTELSEDHFVDVQEESPDLTAN